MMVFAPQRTRWYAADSTKYFSSPRPMSRSAAGAPKSRLRRTLADNAKPATPSPLPRWNTNSLALPVMALKWVGGVMPSQDRPVLRVRWPRGRRAGPAERAGGAGRAGRAVRAGRLLEPVVALEDRVKQQAGDYHDHARHGDDCRPACDLLGDDVHPVALNRQVGLEDGRDEVAQALRPLGRTQHVVVDVLVVGHELLVNDVQVAAHQGVDDLTHRNHDPAEQHQALAQLEAAQLHLAVGGRRGEQLVFQVLDGAIQALNRVEVPINDIVEQPVQQVADAELRQVWAGVPALDDRPDVQPVVLADRYQRPRGDEGGEFARGQPAASGVEVRPVGGEEQMTAVAVQLGALALLHRVLDRQRVQAEFLAQHVEVVAIGVAQVKPDGDRLIGQVIADLGHGEAFEYQVAVAVQPRARLALGRRDLADGGSGHRVGIVPAEGLRRSRGLVRLLLAHRFP